MPLFRSLLPLSSAPTPGFFFSVNSASSVLPSLFFHLPAGCPRFDFLPGSWGRSSWSAAARRRFCGRTSSPIRSFASHAPVIPTAVPRTLRHGVEGSWHHHRVLTPLVLRFSNFAFRISPFEPPPPHSLIVTVFTSV